MRITRALRSVALTAPLALAAGCFDPCDRLADKICDCENTEIETLQCKQRVEIQKDQRKPADEDRAACEAALETCTCEALERMDLAACGFAR